MDEQAQELFGWVVREGLTNVVRHSHATTCSVRLSPDSVEILDDGVGAVQPPPMQPPIGARACRASEERVEQAGGVMEAGPVEPKGLAGMRAPGASRSDGLTIRLLLADDQELIRKALAALLDLEEDFTVVASVGRGDEVVSAAQRSGADVALLDIEMPGIDGLAAAAVLSQQVPACRSLILTTFGRPGYLRRAMDAGANGFVVKDAPAEQLADAIRRVAAGERVVDPALAAETLAHGVSPLSSRERDVLVAAREGTTVAEIAAGSTSRRGPFATISRPPSPRPAPATGRRPPEWPRTRAGSNARPIRSPACGRAPS